MPIHNRVVKSLQSLYIYGVAHPFIWVRTLCLTIVMSALCLRAVRVWPRTGVFLIAAAAVAAAAELGPVPAAAIFLGGGFLVFTALIHTHSDGVGHRVGAHGYTAAAPENSIEALRILAVADGLRAFDAEHFPYIEFDVQETADGELVLFHDPLVAAAFPDGGPNVEAWAALREAGLKRITATVQDLTAAQLGTQLHLGGCTGAHVPTLRQFLE
jgi:hypothetical protein